MKRVRAYIGNVVFNAAWTGRNESRYDFRRPPPHISTKNYHYCTSKNETNKMMRRIRRMTRRMIIYDFCCYIVTIIIVGVASSYVPWNHQYEYPQQKPQQHSNHNNNNRLWLLSLLSLELLVLPSPPTVMAWMTLQSPTPFMTYPKRRSFVSSFPFTRHATTTTTIFLSTSTSTSTNLQNNNNNTSSSSSSVSSSSSSSSSTLHNRQCGCTICFQTFPSRNALFRHVRNHHPTTGNNYIGRNENGINITNLSTTTSTHLDIHPIAIWMGYTSDVTPNQASQIIQDAITSYPTSSSSCTSTTTTTTTMNITITSTTQVSIAKSRPICWNQESHCASAEDIVILKLAIVTTATTATTSSSSSITPPTPTSSSSFQLLPFSLSSLTRHIQDYLFQIYPYPNLNPHVTLPPQPLLLSSTSISSPNLRIHGVRMLQNNNNNNHMYNHSSSYYQSHSFHAEQSCTQHIYHALIPIHYLPLSSQSDIRQWYYNSYIPTSTGSGSGGTNNHNHVGEEEQVVSSINNIQKKTTMTTMSTQPTIIRTIPKIITQLKSIFRSMESPELRPTSSSSRHYQPDPNSSNNDDETEDLEENDSTATKQPSSSSRHRNGRNTTTTTTTTTAKGRFGALAYRIPQYWHNYANPILRLSPNNYEPVYRVIDRARIIDFITLPSLSKSSSTTTSNPNSQNNDDNDDNIYIVCCIIGDQLLQQQVRRMVATAIAMVHGLLPSDFFDYSIHPNHIIETPIFPSRWVYRAHSRFHWHEQYNQGRRIFDSNDYKKNHGNNNRDYDDDPNRYITATEDPSRWMQRTILSNNVATMGSTATTSSEQQHLHNDEWMTELRNVVAPRIRQQMMIQTWQSDPSRIKKQLALPPPPTEYVHVLNLLRSMVSNQLWPKTSIARSNVIHTETTASSSSTLSSPSTTAADSTTNSSGSFTVVNTKLINEKNNSNSIILPKANELFPELAKAVFELEDYIIHNNMDLARAALQNELESNTIETIYPYTKSSPTCRLSSTHCAINCNAQFKPHVDSGRGLGQSVSMIVGLGDYHGGDIFVEQTGYPIRYCPVEFDGWKLRHWTQPFIGSDRFTLVWFTPA